MDDVKCGVENSLVATDKEERKMSKIGKRMMAMLCAVALMVTSLGGVGFVFADEKQVEKPAVAVNYQEVPEKYRAAMQRAVEMGLITPDAKGSVRPNDIMTIAEYATVEWRMYGKWYTKKHADATPLKYIQITIDGEDAKKHWAYVPLKFAVYGSGFAYNMEWIIDSNEKALYNAISRKPVSEAVLLNRYGAFAIDVNMSKESKAGLIPITEDSFDSRKIVIDAVKKDDSYAKDMTYMASGKESGTNSEERIYAASVYAYNGVEFLQAAGILPMVKKGGKLEIHPARQLTRAEVIYTLLTVEDNIRGMGFKSSLTEEVKYLEHMSYYQ